MTARRIAIVGGGYSGTLQAINLLRSPDVQVTLIERRQRMARGAAYSTRHAEHLLNVRAAKMSAFADAPAHFAEWLERLGAGDATSFAERRLYGAYLEELLHDAKGEAGERLELVSGEAVAIERTGAREEVKLAGGGTVAADAVILSVGNLAPQRPREIAQDMAPELYVEDPWSEDLGKGLDPTDQVLLLGTGLTAIDAALMLDSAGFAGEILSLSRRGMVPRAHEDAPHGVPELKERPEGGWAELTAMVRQRGEQIGWQAAIDQLRPHSQAFWASRSVEEKRRFLRHLRPYWDVHRHRIAPQIGRRIEALERRGSLSFAAGKLISTEEVPRGVRVRWRPRGSQEIRDMQVRRIVNCTGPRGDIRASGEALLDQLVGSGGSDPTRSGSRST